MPQQTLIALTVESSLVPSLVRINDRLAIASTAETRAYAIAANHLMLPGTNLLTITVGERVDGLLTSATRVFGPPASFTMTLRSGQRGTVPGPDGMLAEWRLSEPVLVPKDSSGIVVLSRQFECEVPWECAWRVATPSTDDVGPRRLFSALVEALRARDVDTVLRMSAPVYRDRANAMQLAPSRVADSAGEMLRGLIKSKLWAVAADVEKTVFWREGGGRVVRALSVDGSPPILVQADSQAMPFDFSCGFVNREWTLLW